MSTFDIQSMVPEGYEISGGLKTLDHILSDGTHNSFSATLTLRKKWTPKVGEVVACRDNEGVLWQFGIFLEVKENLFIASRCTDGEAVFSWDGCRQLTPEERGE